VGALDRKGDMTMLITSLFSGETDLECIESSLGELLWQIDDPALAPDLATQLELHIRHCAACRLQISLQRDVESGLRNGQLKIHASLNDVPAWVRPVSGFSGLALAASLALIFIIPPSLPNSNMVVRGGDDPEIISPLPDVVIHDRTPHIQWTTMERANKYRVSVRTVDGQYSWSSETTAAEVTIPDESHLPASARLRVSVEPIPAHAAPDGAIRSSFRTGSWREFLGFRVGAAPREILAGALLGGLGLLIGLATLLKHRS
jgi:hypothetical protein